MVLASDRAIVKTFLVVLACVLGITMGGFFDAQTVNAVSSNAGSSVSSESSGDSGFGSSQDTKKYVEGEAIVCISGSVKAAKVANAANAGSSGLLSNAETLIKVTHDASDAKVGIKASTAKATSEQKDSIMLVKSDSLSTKELISELKKMDNVEYAEPNYIYTTQSTDHTGEQWAYNPDLSDYNVKNENWNVPSEKNSEGVVVAVIDTGVDYDHEDLHSVMWDEGLEYSQLRALGGGEYGLNGMAGSSVGQPEYTSDDPMDDHSHGTHCAGIIASAWNDYGTSGAANGAKTMAVKTANAAGQFPSDAVLKGYAYINAAAEAGVNVRAANNSWGGDFAGKAINDAITEAGSHGVVSCFAAGNEGANCDTNSKTCTTLKDNPYVVVVDAINGGGDLTSWSNYGSTTTDVSAPGASIMSTIPRSKSIADPRESTAAEGTKIEDFDRDEVNGTGKVYEYHVKSGDDTNMFLKTLVEDERNNKVLGVKAKPSEEDSIGIVGKANNVKKAKYFTCLVKAVPDPGKDAPDISTAEINIKQSGTEPEKWTKTTAVLAPNKWSALTIMIPNDANLEDFEFNIAFLSMNTTDMKLVEGVTYYTDKIMLTDTAEYYQYMSGTSMATPLVTGEAAILAGKYSDDSADKIAARIIGSVDKNENYSGKNVSEGEVDFKKAVSGQTVPVLNSVQNVNNEVILNGYFFGNGTGTLKIDGVEAAVKKWTDTKITFDLPSNVKKGGHRLDVTSAKGSGHQTFEIGYADNFYNRLPLPEADDPANTLFYNSECIEMTGLNGFIYCFMVGERGNSFWRYSPKQKTNNGWTRLNALPNNYTVGSANCCTVDGKMLFVSVNSSTFGNELCYYDPAKNKWTTQTLTFSVADEMFLSPNMIYNGKELYLIGGSMNRFYTAPSSDYIFKVDLTTGTAKEVGKLKKARTGAVVSCDGVKDIYIAGGVCTDDENNKTILKSIEKVTLTKTGAVSEIIENNIFPTTVTDDQNLSLVGGTIADGMIISGAGIMQNDVVTDDTYTVNPAKQVTSAVSTGKIFATSKLLNKCGCTYNGKFYIIGQNADTKNSVVFAAADVKTLPQPGDVPTAPKLKKSSSVGYRSVKLAWSKSINASSYAVYRATTKKGTYRKVGSTRGLTYTDKKLKTGKKYYYKVKAVSGNAYSTYSNVKYAVPKPAQTKLYSAKPTGTKIALKWGAVSGASGYKVYRATRKSGSYKRIKILGKTVALGKIARYKDAEVKSGKYYYYKVRAYRNVSGKKVHGVFSKVKAAKISKKR